ncbi:uncharacterized protein LOC114349972 [Ostrinia furnacalis]|uniref:uncharacterized protein LOC114349972 n=1 Tax=Ostrinia furnacalis TaxID=93504 RepID=UPI0010397003|nr:uncharacterized protein LOC114349972 [Ostrinia furnacalis]
MDNDAQSVTIAIPKPRECEKSADRLYKQVKINTILKRSMEKRCRRYTNEDSSRKYSITGDKPLTLKHFKRDELLVPFKVYTKTQEHDKHKQKLAIKYNEKYKVIRTDLQKRLHVEYPPDDVNAVTDVDEGFFNYVNGRSLKDRVPLFKSLKFALADLVRIKQEIGTRNDAILNIETNCRNELKMYDLSLKRFTEQAKCFDNFISEDYRKSKDFLDEWDKLKVKLNIKISELQNVAAEEFTIISRLMGLDYLYGVQQKYGRFLYYLSPPSWRSKNREFAQSVEIEAKGFDLGCSSEEETFKVIFDKMQRECFSNLVKPVLYFKHPHDLLNIFDGIEKQELHHFTYVTHLAPHKKMLKEGIVCLKDMMKQESALVASFIKRIETLLEFSAERCVQLETKFFTILNGLFYESVGAPDVLKLNVHLEFCYERIYAEKPMNLDIVTMARAIENFYMDYSKRLEAIHSNAVKRAVAQCIQTERRKMNKARHAARELLSFNRLERDLMRAHEPVTHVQSFLPPIKGAKFQRKVKRQYSTALKIHNEDQKPLDESEIEYLTLFTDWTEGDNPAKYLHRLEDEN